MKFKANGYWEPTPKLMKKIGDALLAVSMYAQTQQMFTGESTALMIIGIIGLVGKFLTNFCTED
jgi:hypothetical protein